MTREEAKILKLFQIVRWNVNILRDDIDPEHEWLLPYCNKLAVVTQKIIWDDGGEEIHLRFPEKKFSHEVFYDDINELLSDYEKGGDITLHEGFDTIADCIDLIF